MNYKMHKMQYQIDRLRAENFFLQEKLLRIQGHDFCVSDEEIKYAFDNPKTVDLLPSYRIAINDSEGPPSRCLFLLEDVRNNLNYNLILSNHLFLTHRGEEQVVSSLVSKIVHDFFCLVHKKNKED